MYEPRAMLSEFVKTWLNYVAKELLKKKVALAALEHIKSDSLVGLGTGSTAKYLIEGLGEKIKRGELSNITAIATSKESHELAIKQGITMLELSQKEIDIAIDGMDEVDPELNLVKGLGGALTREKLVEAHAKKLIYMADDSKIVDYLGQKAPIPVEVIQFGLAVTKAKLTRLELKPVLRLKNNQAFISDNGNYILDCYLNSKRDLEELANQIIKIPGVVEHGLFLNMADIVYIAKEEQIIKMTRDDK